MEKNYNQVFEIRKKHISWHIPIILFVIILIAVIGFIIYTLITSTVSNSNWVKISKSTYYAVTLKSSQDASELEAMYPSANAIGASGYVWKGEDTNYLIALIYPSEDMAKSVIASNQSQNFTLDYISITLPELRFDLTDCDPKLYTCVEKNAQYSYDLANILYELTISVHTGGLSSIACASSINTLKGEMQANLSQLQGLVEVSSTQTSVSDLISKLIKAVNLLDKMVNELISSTSETGSMKYNFCEYVYLFSKV